MPVNDKILVKLKDKANGDDDLFVLARTVISVEESDGTHFSNICQTAIENSVKDEMKIGGDKK